MRLLLDTHALLWTLSDSPKLSRTARAAVSHAENEIVISAASAFEITTKHRLGKLPEFDWIASRFPAALDALQHTPLSISVIHAARAGALGHSHGNPFDRLLIAQAEIEDLTLVSNEKLFEEFGVKRLW